MADLTADEEIAKAVASIESDGIFKKVVERLNDCATAHSGCDRCKEREACVANFDRLSFYRLSATRTTPRSDKRLV